MSRKYKFHNSDGTYFVTFAVQGWVDVFTRNQYKDILIENLTYCIHHKGLEIFAWCSRQLSGVKPCPFDRQSNRTRIIFRYFERL